MFKHIRFHIAFGRDEPHYKTVSCKFNMQSASVHTRTHTTNMWNMLHVLQQLNIVGPGLAQARAWALAQSNPLKCLYLTQI